MTLFALVDCNNFYASCERLFRPDLANKPIVVLSNNDGCVVARSNEIKKLGIKAGTPFYKVKYQLERVGATIFSSNYELYGDISSRVMNILSQAAPDIEVYSIDEAFLNISSFPSTTDLIRFATDLRAKVHLWTGIPVGIGIAKTKTLSKIANHIAKENSGVFVLNNHQQRIEILKKLPVSEVWGVGRKTVPKLTTCGIFSAFDLANANHQMLRSRFSINLVRTSLELQGTPAIPIDEAPQPKQSLAASKSFSKLVDCPQELKEAAITYTMTVAAKLRKNKLFAGNLTVYVQTNKHNSNVKQQHESLTHQLPAPSNSSDILIPIATKLIQRLYMPECSYVKCGIICGGLVTEKCVTTDLFTPVKQESHNLSKALDSINKSYGKDSLFVLGSGVKRPWQMKRNYRSPCRTTSWHELLEVN